MNCILSKVEALEAVGFTIDDGDKDVPKSQTLFPPSEDSALQPRPPKSTGNVCPTSRDGKLFRYVLIPLQEHYAKMIKSLTIECIVIMYLEVPPPNYGIVYTVHTACLIAKQQLYEVTIGDFPSCIDFVSMKASALGNEKKKWICFKHLYHSSMIPGLHH
jgi:hypothetical protein